MKKPKLKKRRRNPALDLDPKILLDCLGSMMLDTQLIGTTLIERAFVASRIPELLKEFRAGADPWECRVCRSTFLRSETGPDPKRCPECGSRRVRPKNPPGGDAGKAKKTEL